MDTQTENDQQTDFRDSETALTLEQAKELGAVGVSVSSLDPEDVNRNTAGLTRQLVLLKRRFGVSEPLLDYYYFAPLRVFTDKTSFAQAAFDGITELEDFLKFRKFEQSEINTVETLGNWSLREALYLSEDKRTLLTVTLQSYFDSGERFRHLYHCRFDSVLDGHLITSSNQRKYLSSPTPEFQELKYFSVSLAGLFELHEQRIASGKPVILRDNTVLKKESEAARTSFEAMLEHGPFERINNDLFLRLVEISFASHCKRCGDLRRPQERLWADGHCLVCAEVIVLENAPGLRRRELGRMIVMALFLTAFLYYVRYLAGLKLLSVGIILYLIGFGYLVGLMTLIFSSFFAEADPYRAA